MSCVFSCSQLHSNRDPIPDAPAVYFCMPTEENLGRISQDFMNGLYDFYHLNFISAISRQKLEDLALASLEANVVMNIHKVCSRRILIGTLNFALLIFQSFPGLRSVPQFHFVRR